jgi:hypothetical protein
MHKMKNTRRNHKHSKIGSTCKKGATDEATRLRRLTRKIRAYNSKLGKIKLKTLTTMMK